MQPFVDLVARVGARPDPQEAGADDRLTIDALKARRPALRRRARPGLGPRRVHAARRRADLVLVTLIVDRAPARLDLRRGRRLRRGPPDRHREPRHARLHLAAAHARRLLDRPLRRDDRPRPLPRAVHLGRRDHRPLRARHARAPLRARRAGAGGRVLSRALPATVLLNLILTWPVYALARRLSRRSTPRPRPRGAAPWLDGTAAAPLPARRPAGRGALPADAAARAPGRDPRLRRARRLRGPLPAALGAPGARRATSTAPRRTTTACARSSRRAARPDRRPQRARARHERARHEPRALAGRPAEELRGAAPSCAQLSMVAGVPSTQISPRSKRARGDPLTPVVVAAAAIHHDQIDYLEEHAARVPRRRSSPTATCAATRTSRSPRRCSATSARSRAAS